MKPEIDRLREEVAKLKAERDILKSRSLLREGSDMRFAFIAKHRSIWPVAWLYDALDVSRSGVHAWLNDSPSGRSPDRRGLEDVHIFQVHLVSTGSRERDRIIAALLDKISILDND